MNDDQPLVTRLVTLLKDVAASTVYEAIGKSGDLDPAIRALVSGVVCVGPAYTVRTPPNEGRAIVEACDNAPAGSVIVIDVGVDTGACTWGGTGSIAAQARGIAGILSSGYVRDIAVIRDLKFPVFARGTTVRGLRKALPGETNVPVVVGGQVVFPGDLICGDDDGVVVIASRHFRTLEQNLAQRFRFETSADDQVKAGVPYGRATGNPVG